MLRSAFALTFLFYLTATCLAQPEIAQVCCVVKVECANNPGVTLATVPGSNTNNCFLCYNEAIDRARNLPLPPCSGGAGYVYRPVSCLPCEDPDPIENPKTAPQFRVLIDFVFEGGLRIGPEGVGHTEAAAYTDALKKMRDLACSGAFGKVCAGTGRCIIIGPDGCRKTCLAPHMPNDFHSELRSGRNQSLNTKTPPLRRPRLKLRTLLAR